MDKMPVQIHEVCGEQFAKVRIPIAINDKGEWIAAGVCTRRKDDAKHEVEKAAAELGYGNVVTHYVYALVPLPIGLVINGELE